MEDRHATIAKGSYSCGKLMVYRTYQRYAVIFLLYLCSRNDNAYATYPSAFSWQSCHYNDVVECGDEFLNM